MAGIRAVRHPAWSGQALVIQATCFQRPVGVVCAQRDHLGHRVAIAIREWIDDLHELASPGRRQQLLDAPRGVVLQLLRHLPETGNLQLHVVAKREHVDHHRHDPLYAVVHRRRKPRRPPPLARPRDHELVDLDAPVLLRLGRRRVHRLDGRLHHRQEQGPRRIARLRVLHERVGNQAVFTEIAEHRLKRHLPHDRGRQAGGIRHGGQHLEGVGRLRDRVLRHLAPTAAVDPEDHAAGVLGIGWQEQRDFVRPGHALPRLAGEAAGPPAPAGHVATAECLHGRRWIAGAHVVGEQVGQSDVRRLTRQRWMRQDRGYDPSRAPRHKLPPRHETVIHGGHLLLVARSLPSQRRGTGSHAQSSFAGSSRGARKWMSVRATRYADAHITKIGT